MEILLASFILGPHKKEGSQRRELPNLRLGEAAFQPISSNSRGITTNKESERATGITVFLGYSVGIVWFGSLSTFCQ
jgi:hypothetical protein